MSQLYLNKAYATLFCEGGGGCTHSLYTFRCSFWNKKKTKREWKKEFRVQESNLLWLVRLAGISEQYHWQLGFNDVKCRLNLNKKSIWYGMTISVASTAYVIRRSVGDTLTKVLQMVYSMVLDYVFHLITSFILHYVRFMLCMYILIHPYDCHRGRRRCCCHFLIYISPKSEQICNVLPFVADLLCGFPTLSANA